jgi:putative transposase
VLHADNGSPMKGATLKATMERLGVIPSYSRPRVSDDNPFSESLFRTLKYRPDYPDRPFESRDEAFTWVEGFVHWYHHDHLHSGIGYVTPLDRHEGHADTILVQRRAIYEAAKGRHPERWGSRRTRAWTAPQEVLLNPTPDTRLEPRAALEEAA